MRISVILLLLGFVLGGCSTETARSGCVHTAVVVDKAGLDGCSLLFKLTPDEFLEPVEWSTDEPELIVGEKYLINYEEIPSATICMAGKPVRITCITSTEQDI